MNSKPRLRQLQTALRLAREQGAAGVWRQSRRRIREALRLEAPLRPVEPPWLRFDARRPAPLLPARADSGPLTLNWIVPPFGDASGGHMTIARLVRELEALGHRSRIHLYHPSTWMQEADAGRERERIHDEFLPLDAQVVIGTENMADADVLVATSWESAYVAHQLAARARAYLVQDFEPSFFPAGTRAVLAENTYRFGLTHLTAGPWLTALLRDRFGSRTAGFDLAPDHEVYRATPGAARDDRTICVYARPRTERRGFELICDALELLAERVPDARALFFGVADLPREPRIPHRNLGVLKPAQLASLYNRSAAGLVVSLTNPSLVPFEMMASGLPVVDVAVESTRAYFGDRPPLTLAAPYPLHISGALAELLTEPARRDSARAAGLAHASALSWEKSALQLVEGLSRFR